ncbi:adapter protein MecA 1 [Collibacillus ludicampi]|uniref:Adapter protein MecA 1 n=1 Tax=Collibacillus ludicampi TaxID=2771369 RepID=A0AAV4LK51_9BACL|nr:adaptor protein MecA [Collibacillus ludicampi]GIM48230.1 adapter protein MecA 1 [Collibacillus ludicampi]
MHVERLGENKVRIFISYDDLEERGIDREEIWQNGRKVQELFWDMMERAYVEVGFEVIGPIAIEAFTMPTEGVVVIVTQISSLPGAVEKQNEELGSIEMNLHSADSLGAFTFVFNDFEEVIRVARELKEVVQEGCSLYHYRDRYFLFFEEESVAGADYDSVWAVLHEYGDLSSVTHAVLEEYGKRIIDRTAIQELIKYFPA